MIPIIDVIAYCIVVGFVVAVCMFFIVRRYGHAKLLVDINQSGAKIRALELEIEELLQNRHVKMQEKEEIFEQKLVIRRNELENEFMLKLNEVNKEKDRFQKEIQSKIEDREREANVIMETKTQLLLQKEEQEKILKQCKSMRENLISSLEEYTSLTKDEGKTLLLKQLEEDLTQEKAKLIRRYESEAKSEAQSRANYIIAQATTRFAGDFVGERLINMVNIPNEEMKGKIIGKDGRNIKALENIIGVDVIIGDNYPNSIVLSSFNLYRRAIATKTIEELIQDGRIQPSRIEEVYEKVKSQMEEQIRNDGEAVVLDLGIGYVHPELKRLVGRLKYRASFGQNALGHSLEVARLAGVIAAELGGDEKLARRAGLLHDIGKALTDDHGGNHVDLGAEVCLRYKEHPAVINAIYAHHGHEEANSIESSAVCTADVLSAARPGARREVLENHLRRVQNLEKIAMEKFGVKQAYAIYAGKEIRVIVRADIVNDSQTIVLAKEIANDIKRQLQYPGEIKVNVIRELRAIETA